jgi:hypothetical protein
MRLTLRSKKPHPDNSSKNLLLHKSSHTWATLAIMILATPSQALELNYGGRLTEESGKPFEGTVTIKVQFFSSPANGDPLMGKTLEFPHTELHDGVFSITMNLSPTEIQEIFGDGLKDAYLQIQAGDILFPRQKNSHKSHSS